MFEEEAIYVDLHTNVNIQYLYVIYNLHYFHDVFLDSF